MLVESAAYALRDGPRQYNGRQKLIRERLVAALPHRTENAVVTRLRRADVR